ncbi:hypothetical protein GCM10017562_72920 [Streptomyces roseofulvus]
MNTTRRADTTARALCARALALIGSTALLTFGTAFADIFHLTVGTGA